jgi:FkbM family methyltransferase
MIEVPEQDKLTSQLLNNIAISISQERGGEPLATALAMQRRAMRLNPLDVGRMLNMANLLVRTGEDEEAEKLLTISLKREPKLWLAWQILGVIRTHEGQLDEAIECFKRAYEIDPENGQRKFDLAAAYLRAGDFANGLPLYEFRHEILPKTNPPPEAPTWRGEKTGHLAVWADQGHGDRIMFARFLPWAKERADKVTLLTDPASVPLLMGYHELVDIGIGWDHEKTKFDHQVSLGSLPILYGLTPSNIPADPGLLSVAKTEGQLGAPGLKIGIVWYGNPEFPGNDMRTVPFAELLPLAADPRNTVFSLQCGVRSGDIARMRAQRIVHDLSGQIEGEWSHTAAVIKNLDLVVSSCTAVAHLAGALGIPTFIMLPRFADWRWLSGDTTPWYPQTRLFRQTRVGEWKSVVARILKAVDQMHQRRALVGMLNRAQVSTDRPAGAEYEPEVAEAMRQILRPGDCFVDVGAASGLHTVPAAKLVGPDGKVLAFEPGPQNLPALRAAVAALPQVEIVEQPLSSAVGPGTFYLNRDNENNSLWDPGEWPGAGNEKTKASPQPVEVFFETLDRVTEARSLNPRLIKIDTEGAEELILRGAAALLFEKAPPFIIAELHEFGLEKLGCSQQSLRTLMLRAGYATFALSRSGAAPKLIPADQELRSQYILNLLFAKPDDVAAVWPAAQAAA